MPIDSTRPDTPGYWFHRLYTELVNRHTGYTELWDRFTGNPPLPLAPNRSREIYSRFVRLANANWADLIVAAVAERMQVTGFQTGAEGDETGDAEAWAIWQANHLDAEATLLFETMLAMGDAYMIVGPPPATGDRPLITVEDPREVITADDPTRRHRARAALKVWTDEWTDKAFAHLFMPGVVYRLTADVARTGVAGFPTVDAWEFDTGYGTQRTLPGEVPVVRFRNRAAMTPGPGRSEFGHVVDDLDRIATMILHRVTIAMYQAFRQRAVTGVPVDGSDADFDWDQALRADPGSLWRLPDGVAMWESAGVDLTPILESVRADVRDLAARTRTPMFYLFPDTTGGSAEGAALQREGLVFKTRNRLTASSEPLERAMSYAFRWAGDTERADLVDMETLWAPPERFTLAERYDAAIKAKAAGVPWSTVMADVLQFSPQQIARMSLERSTDVFLDPDAGTI